MLTRLLENWPYKLAALAIAIALRIYVSHIDDPHTIKQINIPLSLTGVSDSMIVTDYSPNVTLQLSGPASSLDGITGTSYTARVDVHAAHTGSNNLLPILVVPNTTIPSDVTMDSQMPRMASVTLDAKARKRFAIRVSFQKVAPAGFTYGAPSAVPPVAAIEGPATAVNSVARLSVYGDDAVSGETTSLGVLDGFAQIEAQDEHGKAVAGVTILPAQAEVRIRETRVAAVKELIVNPTVVGEPAYPAQVESVSVTPNRIAVTGATDLLSATSVAETAPVDITGANTDIVRTITIDLPPGLTAARPGGAKLPDATVTIHLHGSAPAGAAAPAAPNAPSDAAQPQDNSPVRH